MDSVSQVSTNNSKNLTNTEVEIAGWTPQHDNGMQTKLTFYWIKPGERTIFFDGTKMPMTRLRRQDA